MIKKYNAVQEVSNVIKAASEETVSELLKSFEEKYADHIKGREENITDHLETEITGHLIDRIKKKLNGKEIKGIKFTVKTFKRKTQEPFVGADLLGVLELDLTSQKITKSYLAQAKVVKFPIKKKMSFGDSRLQDQVSKMLRITSDSFVFVYTPTEIRVVPAFAVQQSGASSLNLDSVYHHNFGTFYRDFFTCFVGDHHISPWTEDLTDIATEHMARHGLLIKAQAIQLEFDHNKSIKRTKSKKRT